MVIQAIVDIPVLCAAHGIRQAVICPGSRSAAITIAFARYPEITTYVIPDERSAGFIALGLAQSSRLPVVVVCTSGTAVANLYPAVIEAFYQEVPLLIITADRPPELIGQQDGQAIIQDNLYANHIRGYFQFPVAPSTKSEITFAHRLVNEAILCANNSVKGPVHLNVPIREPFYPLPDEKLNFSGDLKIIRTIVPPIQVATEYVESLIREIKSYQRIMVLVGQQIADTTLIHTLERFRQLTQCVVVGELFSNLHTSSQFITNHEVILADQDSSSALKPDLLISFGGSVISKSLKNFLRNNSPKSHWHIGENPDVVDTFQSLTQKIKMPPLTFLQSITDGWNKEYNVNDLYSKLWQKRSQSAEAMVGNFLTGSYQSEFIAVSRVIEKLPKGSSLHLANSMSVRYACYVGLKVNTSVWSNRGTSGIDGCTSTAVGHAINTPNLHILITGDMAFFYDRNGLWHQHLPSNLRIVVLNNHGGGIFRLIDGPGKLPELETYFETNQPQRAENTARDFGMRYYFTDDLKQLDGLLNSFLSQDGGAAILEIETNPIANEAVFTQFKQRIRQHWKK